MVPGELGLRYSKQYSIVHYSIVPGELGLHMLGQKYISSCGLDCCIETATGATCNDEGAGVFNRYDL